MKARYLLIILLLATYFTYGSDNNKTFEGKYLFTNQVKTSPFKSAIDNMVLSKNKIVTELTLSREYANYTFVQSGKEIVINDFPINTLENSKVTLTKVAPVVDASTIWIAKTKNASERIQGIPILSFTGTVESNPKATIFLSYIDGNLFGTIDNHDGTKFSITTATESLDDKSVNPKIIISDHNIVTNLDPSKVPFTCLTNENEIWNKNTNNNKTSKVDNNATLTQSTKLLEVKVAIDAEYTFCNRLAKNNMGVQSYIASVMAQVSYIYEQNFNTRITVSKVVLRTTKDADPYYNKGDTTIPDMLPLMPSVWRDNLYGDTIPQGTSLVVLFLSMYDHEVNGSAVAGLAMEVTPGEGELCNQNTGYCATGMYCNIKNYPNYNFTWDVDCVAHEMGHLFGNNHTHNCYYLTDGTGVGLIDSCVTWQSSEYYAADRCPQVNVEPVHVLGTIMSYCHLLGPDYSVDLNFAKRQIDLTRKAIEYHLSDGCVYEPTKPVIAILDPLVNTTLYGGKNYTIRWTSAHVSFVTIKYSLDNGSTWNTLVTSTSALDSTKVWAVPNIATSAGLIIIADASDPTVADTTNVNFTIISPSITVTAPSDILSYGHKEKMSINWTKTNISYCKVQFSSNGGTKWITLAGYDSTKNTTMQWTIPDSITSDNCKIRITSVDAGYTNIYAESPTFAIGSPVFKWTVPGPGAYICSKAGIWLGWQSKYVSNIYWYYSIDSGATWKKVITSITTEPTHYCFITAANAPKINSTKMKLKAVLKDDITVGLDSMSYVFTIDSTCKTDVNENAMINSKFSIKSIVPNPVQSIATINYECKDNNINEIEFYIADMNGRVMQSPTKMTAYCGSNSIQYNMSEFTPGNYMLFANINGEIISYPFVVVK